MKKTVIFSLLVITSLAPLYANLRMAQGNATVRIFISRDEKSAMTGVVKGKVIGFGTSPFAAVDNLQGNAREKSSVTVRLVDSDGIKEGDVLYVIDPHNLVVSRLTVASLYQSASFGTMLIGTGNFSLSRTGFRVVQKAVDRSSRYAYIHVERGQYHQRMGNRGNAIRQYKEALSRDPGNPEAHLALGTLYLEQGLLRVAYTELSIAYKNISRLYDIHDRYSLLLNLCRIRSQEIQNQYLPDTQRQKFINEGLEFAHQGISLRKEAPEMYYFAGYFETRRSGGKDVKARDYFLKVLEYNPLHVESLVHLAELYMKHDNPEKAKNYITQALKADPMHERARQVQFYLEKYNR